MRRVYYSSGSVLTGDDIARAVLEFAEALANDGRADIIEIPVLLASGTSGSAVLLVGPASQLASVSEESPFDEPRDEAVLVDLRNRTSRLGSPRPAAQQQMYAEYLSTHEDYE